MRKESHVIDVVQEKQIAQLEAGTRGNGQLTSKPSHSIPFEFSESLACF
jgi:hypothetical protein